MDGIDDPGAATRQLRTHAVLYPGGNACTTPAEGGRCRFSSLNLPGLRPRPFPEGKMVKAWHFVGDTLRDGRPVPPDGETLRHDGDIIICKHGLHASLSAFDALLYAPGNILCLVECAGDITYGDDKLVCSERTIIARKDIEPLLWAFARQQALFPERPF